MSTPAENAAIVRRYIEASCNHGNLAIIDEVFSPDFVYRGLAPPAGMSAVEGYQRAVAGARAAFPDYRVTFEEMMAEGEPVAYHVTWRGTHLGEFRGIPPTGKVVAWQATCFRRVVDGQVVEGWGTYDWLGLMQQLGATVALPAGSTSSG